MRTVPLLGWSPARYTAGPSPFPQRRSAAALSQGPAASESLFDNPYVSLPISAAGAVVGFMAGRQLPAPWGTVGYLAALLSGLRAATDFGNLMRTIRTG